ncbi:hypothetical protein BDV29DRAFT_174404 [Aspergillus leporis]|uniref:Uncharacterized protein n=1 Tax=Aspergillus leporis TaxID=41062 RepID=A0A5N5WZK4_9EURO|nr:hypothetical protein BDV29DRAFT_174404 [Aspergillus leporis]
MDVISASTSSPLFVLNTPFLVVCEIPSMAFFVDGMAISIWCSAECHLPLYQYLPHYLQLK